MTEEKRPTAVLQEEHHFIQKVVAAMVVMADRLEMGLEVKTEAIREMVDYMHLVDSDHEGKEELYLFATLKKKGISVHSVPTRMLVEEHQRGKALVAKLEQATADYEAGKSSAKPPLVESLRCLAALYPLHIWQEDMLLFPQANNALTPEDDAELLGRFVVADEAAGGDVLRRFERIAEKIQKETW